MIAIVCASLWFASVFNVLPFLFATLDTDVEEVVVTGFLGEELDYVMFLKTRDKPRHRQAILKACNYFESCMFYILKVFKTKTYLCVAILLLLLFL